MSGNKRNSFNYSSWSHGISITFLLSFLYILPFSISLTLNFHPIHWRVKHHKEMKHSDSWVSVCLCVSRTRGWSLPSGPGRPRPVSGPGQQPVGGEGVLITCPSTNTHMHTHKHTLTLSLAGMAPLPDAAAASPPRRGQGRPADQFPAPPPGGWPGGGTRDHRVGGEPVLLKVDSHWKRLWCMHATVQSVHGNWIMNQTSRSYLRCRYFR